MGGQDNQRPRPTWWMSRHWSPRITRSTPIRANRAQQVTFGTSGHRGSALKLSFNDDHIAATTQAICDYRASSGITGPLYIGRDTHALSEPALVTALEVLTANEVTVLADSRDGYTPTPAVSLAILEHNNGRTEGLADGIVVTPSHNPPEDGGFKYNPPDGGPAATQITSVIQDRANELLRDGLRQVRRIRYDRARAAVGSHDFLGQYVSALPSVVDLDAVRSAGVRIGADPLGGASVAYWGEIGGRFGLDLTVVNPVVDATFRFMTLDWDGRIRMDCSSPYAMASLIERRADFADCHRQRHRRRPARHRDPRVPACSTPTTTWPRRSTICTGTAGAGRVVPRSARPWSAPPSSTASPRRPGAA